MRIGEAAAASGVSAKRIRHYEAIGLIPAPGRQVSNYRAYGKDDIHRLQFIRRARALGFSVDRIRDLLALWSDRNRHSADVKAIALAHVAELETRIDHLRQLVETLRGLADCCDGDARPACPIIRDLEGSREFRPAEPA